MGAPELRAGARNRYQLTVITDVDGGLSDEQVDAVVAAARRAVPGRSQVVIMSRVLLIADDPPPGMAARREAIHRAAPRR